LNTENNKYLEESKIDVVKQYLEGRQKKSLDSILRSIVFVPVKFLRLQSKFSKQEITGLYPLFIKPCHFFFIIFSCLNTSSDRMEAMRYLFFGYDENLFLDSYV